MNQIREEVNTAESDNVIDIALLSLPIAVDAEAGTDLRQDASPHSIYYKIKEARNQARAIERQQSQGIANGSAREEWQKVITLAKEILTTQSKDLEITAWLIEALLREHGFAGLRDGFLLTYSLCTKYWTVLHPNPENEPFYKVAAFSGLNGDDSDGTLIGPIFNVPLTQGDSVGPFAQWQFQQAMEISHIADTEKQAKRIALGGITLKDIETAKSETNKQFFITLHADLIACHTSYDQLSYFLDTEIGNESPPSSRIRNALTQCLDTLTFLAGSILNQSKPIPDSEDQSAAPSIQRTFNISTTNLDRDAAFETLQTIANYFRQTEPHSPLSYLIQKTIQWGKLSLPQLLEELIKDDDVRKQLFTLTGIEAQ